MPQAISVSLMNIQSFGLKTPHSDVDFVNGFIESYGDPLGMTGSYESYVNFKNGKASARTEAISSNAQWFEDNSLLIPASVNLL